MRRCQLRWRPQSKRRGGDARRRSRVYWTQREAISRACVVVFYPRFNRTACTSHLASIRRCVGPHSAPIGAYAWLPRAAKAAQPSNMVADAPVFPPSPDRKVQCRCQPPNPTRWRFLLDLSQFSRALSLTKRRVFRFGQNSCRAFQIKDLAVGSETHDTLML